MDGRRKSYPPLLFPNLSRCVGDFRANPPRLRISHHYQRGPQHCISHTDTPPHCFVRVESPLTSDLLTPGSLAHDEITLPSSSPVCQLPVAVGLCGSLLVHRAAAGCFDLPVPVFPLPPCLRLVAATYMNHCHRPALRPESDPESKSSCPASTLRA